MKKTSIQYSKEILTDELAKENKNSNASNSIAPADMKTKSIKNQLEQMRKDQHN